MFYRPVIVVCIIDGRRPVKNGVEVTNVLAGVATNGKFACQAEPQSFLVGERQVHAICVAVERERDSVSGLEQSVWT